jgi:hypothetical protein
MRAAHPEAFMKSFARRPTVWIVLVLCLGFSGSAAAQPTLSIGYQALHLPDNWVNAGFNIDVAGPLSENLSIVGEFGLATQGTSGSDPVEAELFHFGGGPRWSWPLAQVTPFVQILAGAERTSAEFILGGVEVEDSDTAFMLQPGGGIYVPVGDRWGIVGQADLRSVFFSEETDNQFRVVLGVRFSLR